MLPAFLKNNAAKLKQRISNSGVAGRVLGLVALCGIGAFVKLPGVDGQALPDFFRLGGGSSLIDLYDVIVGGALARGAVVAIGIMPLISAKIYLAVAKMISPKFAAQMKGSAGERKLVEWTRGLTFGLALIQSYGFVKFLESVPGVVANPGPQFVLQSMLLLTAGAMGITLLNERLRGDSVDAESSADATDPVEDLPIPQFRKRSDVVAENFEIDPLLLNEGKAPDIHIPPVRELVEQERE